MLPQRCWNQNGKEVGDRNHNLIFFRHHNFKSPPPDDCNCNIYYLEVKKKKNHWFYPNFLCLQIRFLKGKFKGFRQDHTSSSLESLDNTSGFSGMVEVPPPITETITSLLLPLCPVQWNSPMTTHKPMSLLPLRNRERANTSEKFSVFLAWIKRLEMRITCTLISLFYHLCFQMGFTLANGRHVITALRWSVFMGEARGLSESSVSCLGLNRWQRRSQCRAVPPLTLLRPRACLLPASSVTVYAAVCFSVFPRWGQQAPSEITPSCMGRNNH